jgi:hypothetical protein
MEIALRVWTVPLVVAIVLSICGYYAFYRLKRKHTQEIIPLMFVFMISLFFVPLSLQYLGCSWWSDNPGYWDDRNGEIMAVLYILTFLICPPILVVFYRRAISMTSSRFGWEFSMSRARLALGITLASILVSVTAFAFIAVTGIVAHDSIYRYHAQGRNDFMKENIALRNDFVSGYQAIFPDQNTNLPEWKAKSNWFIELSWFIGEWHERPEHFGRIDHRSNVDSIPKIIIAFFWLSFMFAVPLGTTGTLLGIGYLRRERREKFRKERTYAAVAVGLLPCMALILLVGGLIGWVGLQSYESSVGGFTAITSLVYLVVFSAMAGFFTLVTSSPKEILQPLPAPPSPKKSLESQTPKEDQPPRQPTRKLAGWGCSLLVLGFIVFWGTALLWLKPVQHESTFTTLSSGEIVHSLQPKEPAGPSTFLLLLAFVALGGSILLPSLGTWFGWRHLNRIRKTPEKPGWLPGMIAALLAPCFLLWFVPWLIGVTMGVSLGGDLGIPGGIAQFLGGMTAFIFTLCVAIPVVWCTWRWVFPKPPAPPSPKGWAVWGAWLVLASFVIPNIGFGLIFLARAGASGIEFNQRQQQLQHAQRMGEYDTSIAQVQKEIRENTDERRLKTLQWQLDGLVRDKAQERQKVQAEHERYVKRLQNTEIAFSISVCVVSLFAIVLAVIGMVFGWRYLALVRGHEKKPAILAGYFAALAFVLVNIPTILGLLAHFLFQQGDWGAQQNFVAAVAATVGVMIGIALDVFIIRLTIRWVSGSQITEKNIDSSQ